MARGSATRSGLLWEVERILEECTQLPQVLLMENVPDVIGKKNIVDFQEWQQKLEALGYSNFIELINAKNMGIPQNRNRCFMVSILGKWYYEFPTVQPLVLRLKDMLEEHVDEKYYLSEKQVNYFQEATKKHEKKGNGYKFAPVNTEAIAKACTTSGGLKTTDNFIIVCGCVRVGSNEMNNRVYSDKGISPTITCMQGGNQQPKIKCEGTLIPEATKKGYQLAKDGDGVYINRPHQKRGCVQHNMIQTLKTSCSDVGVVSNERIRRLTPRECWRLMGFSDYDFDKVSDILSNTQLYKLAGNSIVLNVLKGIFKNLLE